MTPEQVRQVEELFHAAMEAAPGERAALLAQADPAVRLQVEALLDVRSSDQLFDRPAVHLLEELTVTELASGDRLGPYSIEGRLGVGGMGEVFRAIDTRLGRAVAIKIADERFTARFGREARAIASLNHPNICTLYDVGPNYLVMELVEGETLASLLKRGALDLDTVQSFGRQIATGLAAAHSRGVIHRDLKPGNIMVGPTGIKILDFGLSKSDRDETVTVSQMILGTPAYMSPEQKQARPADERSDIYSLGCILHEMATGARPDSGRKIASPRLAGIVDRCLNPNPDRRWQTALEVERELAAMNATSRHWKYVAGAASAVLVAAVLYWTLRQHPRLTNKDTIVLADIQNKTGDPVFDQTLRGGMAIELEQSPFLQLISEDKVHGLLTQMGYPKEVGLRPAFAREVCERAGSSAVLEGSIAMVGSRYLIWLRATGCRTGDVLDEEQMQATGKEDVLKVMSQMARTFRIRVGESLATVEQHSTPLDEATTHSLEALKLYMSAEKVGHSNGLSAGVALLNRAVKLDPNFALAHAHLGFWYNNLQEFALSRASATKAYELRDRTTAREGYFIAANYDRHVTGNLVKARQSLESWAQTYPRDVTPHGMMSGFVCQSAGEYAKAIAEANKAIALDPEFVPPYLNLALSYVYIDDLTAAERVLQQPAGRKLETTDLLEVRYCIAFLKGDQPGMDREASDASAPPEWKARVALFQALVLARTGRLQMARAAMRNAIGIAQQAGEQEKAVLYQARTAVWEALIGDRASAIRSAKKALSQSRSRDVEYAVALSLAAAGELQSAQPLIDDLDKRFAEDTSVRFNYLPVLRGVWYLARGKFSEALQELQKSEPAELAIPASGFSAFFGALYPAYYRGQAFFRAGRGAEAAKEFRKVIDHRGLVMADPLDALARLQLARALALAGQKAESKAAYEDVLALWKDAPDLPVFQEARSEYSKL